MGELIPVKTISEPTTCRPITVVVLPPKFDPDCERCHGNGEDEEGEPCPFCDMWAYMAHIGMSVHDFI